MSYTKPNYDEQRGYGCFLMFICGVSFIVSIIALAGKFPRVLTVVDNGIIEGGYDYLGIIISILSLFVALLLGWQIFNAIEMRGLIKEIDDIKEDNARQSQEIQNQKHYTTANLYYSLARSIKNNASCPIDYREAYRQYAEALAEFLEVEPDDFIDRCIAGMEACQNIKEAFQFTWDPDISFVEACNKAHDRIEDRFGRLNKEQREKIKKLSATRKKYHQIG